MLSASDLFVWQNLGGKVYFATSVHPHTFSPFKPINMRCTGYHRLKQWEGSITSFGGLCVCVWIIIPVNWICLVSIVCEPPWTSSMEPELQVMWNKPAVASRPVLIGHIWSHHLTMLKALLAIIGTKLLWAELISPSSAWLSPCGTTLPRLNWMQMEPTNPPVGIHLLPLLYLWNQHRRCLIRKSKIVGEAIADEIP